MGRTVERDEICNRALQGTEQARPCLFEKVNQVRTFCVCSNCYICEYSDFVFADELGEADKARLPDFTISLLYPVARHEEDAVPRA